MKKGLTELVFILDRSGSMSGLESDTIGGYNSMLEKQKKVEGEALVTTVLFDDKYELLHDRVNLRGVVPITEKEYYVRGTTALLDAIGLTINKIVNAHKHISKEEVPDHTLFVITTDGMENASREYTYDKVREMVEYQKNKYGWEFIFLGANIDAIETAQRFGIDKDRSANYNADSEGTILNFQVISEAVSNIRVNKKISDNWKAPIEEDYNRRKVKR
ncbi:MAG: VWA domain-containing protein [Tissierellia bacterium]|nr:VWA domain-containing protein [Tissierellia bacterium]